MRWSIFASVLAVAPVPSYAAPPPATSNHFPLEQGSRNSTDGANRVGGGANSGGPFGISYAFEPREQAWPTAPVEEFLNFAKGKVEGRFDQPFARVRVINERKRMYLEMYATRTSKAAFRNIDARNTLNQVRQFVQELGWSSHPTVRPFHFDVWDKQRTGGVRVAIGKLKAIHPGLDDSPFELGGANHTSVENVGGSNTTAVGDARNPSADQSRFTVTFTAHGKPSPWSAMQQTLTAAANRIPLLSTAPFTRVAVTTLNFRFFMSTASNPPTAFTQMDAREILRHLSHHIMDEAHSPLRLATPFSFRVSVKVGAWPQRNVLIAKGDLNPVHPDS